MTTERGVVFNLGIKFKSDVQQQFSKFTNNIEKAIKGVRDDLNKALGVTDVRLKSIETQNTKTSKSMKAGFANVGDNVAVLNKRLDQTKTKIEQVGVASKKVTNISNTSNRTTNISGGGGGGFGGAQLAGIAGLSALAAASVGGTETKGGSVLAAAGAAGGGAAIGFSAGGPIGAVIGAFTGLASQTNNLIAAFDATAIAAARSQKGALTDVINIGVRSGRNARRTDRNTRRGLAELEQDQAYERSQGRGATESELFLKRNALQFNELQKQLKENIQLIKLTKPLNDQKFDSVVKDTASRTLQQLRDNQTGIKDKMNELDRQRDIRRNNDITRENLIEEERAAKLIVNLPLNPDAVAEAVVKKTTPTIRKFIQDFERSAEDMNNRNQTQLRNFEK